MYIFLTRIFCICILFSGFVLSGPEISAGQPSAALEGTITSEAGEPLAGATIALPDLQAGTHSDDSGYFFLPDIPAGRHSVRISMVGFRTLEQDMNFTRNDTVAVQISLSPVTLEPGEVVVTASRRSRLIGDVAVSMNTVSAAELSSRNIISLDQILETVPGVRVTGNQVDIRGSSGFSYGVGSRVLLLVDGVPLMGPDRGNIDFEGLPLAQTRQIEIVKSPGSALYGGGALGGVINLITKDFPESPETTLRFFTGAYPPVRYKQWKAGWEGAGRYRPVTGIRVDRAHKAGDRFGYWFSGLIRKDAGYLQGARYRGAEGYMKLGWNLSERADFSFFAGIKRSKENQFLYWRGLGDVLRPGLIGSDDEQSSGTPDIVSDRLTLLPVFSHNINPNLQYTLKGRLFGAAFRPLDDQGRIRPAGTHTLGIRYGAEAQVNASPLPHLDLTAGMTYDANVVESDVYVGEDSLTVRSQPEGALFFQVEYAWNQRFNTTAGIRYDAYQVHTRNLATRWSPKLSLSYKLSERVTARASFGQGFRVPGLAERFVQNDDYLPLISNITIRPETSTGYETGAVADIPFASRIGLKAEITGFLNRYEDLVEPQFIPSEAAFQFINLTEARIRGLETTLSLYDTAGRFDAKLGYTWLDSRDTDLDEPLPYRSEHLLQVSVRASLISWMEAGADFRAASAPERVNTGFSLFVDDAGLFPESYVTDVRFRFHKSSAEGGTNLSASFLVNNLFDYYYVERPAYFAPPRNFRIVLEVGF